MAESGFTADADGLQGDGSADGTLREGPSRPVKAGKGWQGHHVGGRKTFRYLS